MDLHRIATRVARHFTAGAPESLDGLHGVLKGIRVVQGQGQEVVELASGTEVVGPELDKVNAAVSTFTSKWGPAVKEMQSEASTLVRSVGDAVVRSRRTRTRG